MQTHTSKYPVGTWIKFTDHSKGTCYDRVYMISFTALGEVLYTTLGHSNIKEDDIEEAR